MSFPLPLSNNWRVFGLPIVSGPLAGNVVVFPGDFKKEGQQFEPRHVFILQHNETKQFQFVFWSYNKRSPTLLPLDAWPLCFSRDKIQKASNRYLIDARGRNIILPYLPETLHQRWSDIEIDLNKPDLTFTNAIFNKLIQPLFLKHQQRAISRTPFTGWQKQILEHNSDLAIQSYKCQLMKEKQNITPTTIDITVPFEKLEKKQREQVKQAFQLMLNLFPNFITSSTA